MSIHLKANLENKHQLPILVCNKCKAEQFVFSNNYTLPITCACCGTEISSNAYELFKYRDYRFHYHIEGK